VSKHELNLPHPSGILARPELEAQSGRRAGGTWKRFWRARDAIAGATLALIILACAVFSPQLAAFDPNHQELMRSMRPPAWYPGGTWETPLGTDFLGRDILSRVIYGSRVSLAVGLGGVLLAAMIGSLLGMLGAYFGGLFDRAVCWIVDTMLGLPYLLFVIVVIGVIGPSLLNVIIVLGISDFPIFARMMRSEILAIKEKEFVQAAITIGVRPFSILRRHMLVNTAPTLITLVTFEMAAMILYESGLGFLGLSVPPAVPSWGNMLSEGRSHLTTSWWMATFPGLAIMITSLGINLLGEWLRVEMDPHLRGRQ
jgi:ABC-type dipeptide/oligopeptide/nickel transport system permease subunit